MKVTLTFVKNEPKVSKNGKPYTSCSIKTVEHGKDVWLNGFGNAQTKSWNIGDSVEVEVYEEEYNGKTYTKFRTLTAEDKIEELTRNLRTVCDIMRAMDSRLSKLESDHPLIIPSAPSAHSAKRFEEEVIKNPEYPL